MVNIEEVLGKVNSKMRKNFTTGEDYKTEKLELPSLGLTKALGGGLPYGRIVTIHGSKSAGKTSLALQAIGAAQKDGKVCAFIDAERTFDSAWAEQLGVDTENLLVSQSAGMDEVGEEIKALCEAGVDIIIVDSISALVQSSYFDKDGELGDMSQTRKIGDFSKNLKAVLKSVNFQNRNRALIILISQQTTKFMSGGHAANVAEGGKALEYDSTQIIKLNSTRRNIIEKDIKVGNKSFSGPVGREVEWTVDFNKVGPPHQVGKYEFYFIGDEVGVDQRLELLHLAMEGGVMERRGAWYYYGDDKWQGADAVIEWLSEDDVFTEVKNKVME